MPYFQSNYRTILRAHSTPDPEQPSPEPDDEPPPDELPLPQHAPIEEPQPKPHPVQAACW